MNHMEELARQRARETVSGGRNKEVQRLAIRFRKILVKLRNKKKARVDAVQAKGEK